MLKKIVTVCVLAVTLAGPMVSVAQAGRCAGPGYNLSRVEAHSTKIFHECFLAGELAVITVVGDGDTDLDLYVYDENGNLIASDSDTTDRCVVTFTPRWSGRFRIELRNRGGVYNRYLLETN